ncbi:hypothetical protein K435DRAFT_855550 [Dendrothele bispora CBS 962.96]|uniref:Uncharacterized protein n=1 Tax=Dendrothele bispora (strain CBS 962.96) TaxID=1314807 RepID=A0A4S8MAX6_DENBC|nr:hypothetical protein K435DRAFT_855550 [Dendrothele bispora CBS 962.96]
MHDDGQLLPQQHFAHQSEDHGPARPGFFSFNVARDRDRQVKAGFHQRNALSFGLVSTKEWIGKHQFQQLQRELHQQEPTLIGPSGCLSRFSDVLDFIEIMNYDVPNPAVLYALSTGPNEPSVTRVGPLREKTRIDKDKCADAWIGARIPKETIMLGVSGVWTFVCVMNGTGTGTGSG